MKITHHSSSSRGLTSTDWLVSRHSFSFANYYNPERMGFGKLLVLNDDLILPNSGFPPHHHANMEIITVGLEGTLRHEDSMGNVMDIQANDVQTMSAGSGVTHSEINPSPDTPAKILQIWIHTAQQNITPFYDQKSFKNLAPDQITLVAGPKSESTDHALIHQQAWLSLVELSGQTAVEYALKNAVVNGVYCFVISGNIQIDKQSAGKGDALAIEEASSIAITTTGPSKILLIEMPL